MDLSSSELESELIATGSSTSLSLSEGPFDYTRSVLDLHWGGGRMSGHYHQVFVDDWYGK